MNGKKNKTLLKLLLPLRAGLMCRHGMPQCQGTPAAARRTPNSLCAGNRFLTKSDDRPLSEQLGAPERYAAKLTGAGGKLTISIDAPVVLPQGDLPILRVQAAEFTQEQVTKAFSTLCGDTPMHLNSDVMTKSEIEAAIAAHEKNLEDESSSS
jgi:hypothetical protein